MTSEELFSKCNRSYSGNSIQDTEIDRLPLPLRACWHIYPWQRSFKPGSVEDWSRTLGWLKYRNFYSTQEEAAGRAIEEVSFLVAFLTRELILFGADIEKATHGFNRLIITSQEEK